MIGKGSAACQLTETEVTQLCEQAFAGRNPDKKKILFIIPDSTRSGPLDMVFRALYAVLEKRLNYLDFLIALGTHHPMSDEAIFRRLGINADEHRQLYPKARFFNHAWKDRDQLVNIGTIGEDDIAELSGGQLREKVDVTINRMVLDYDLIIIIGPTFPHEVVGFSGGNKYLFPGIAGPEIIDMFHWLGALITSPVIIGRRYTPVRRIVDMAAEMVPTERLNINMVVKDGGLAGLYIDTPEKAWEAASELSGKIHIQYMDNPFWQVLSCAPPMYDDLWVGAKCMYKLEPVVADGGELIIYAPHIREVSITHGEMIEKTGYHVRDYFLKQPDRFKDLPGGIKAHCTHVKGAGTFEEGVERARIKLILATGIPEDLCVRLNLGYRDPASIELSDFQGRESEGILCVKKAGEMLFRLKNDPFKMTSPGYA